MIITEKKPFEEVLAELEGSKNIAVLGCGRCATSCQTGGENEIKEMVAEIEKKGYYVSYQEVVEAQCDERLTKRSVKKAGDVDTFISMSCGSGASALSDLTDKKVVPSSNTLFLGVMKRIGEYEERCSMCGECVLPQTNGVCVVTRCSKGLMNGPCGGSQEGKCEVDDERDCAWTIVINRFDEAGEKDKIKDQKKPRTVHKNSRPRKVKR